MANIDVVPKQHGNTWMWILLAVIVAALVVWALTGRTHAATQLQSIPAEVAAAVSAAFVDAA